MGSGDAEGPAGELSLAAWILGQAVVGDGRIFVTVVLDNIVVRVVLLRARGHCRWYFRLSQL